jgi:ribonuclease HIII
VAFCILGIITCAGAGRLSYGKMSNMQASPSTYTIAVNESTLTKMADFYHEQFVQVSSPYVAFLAKGEDVSITAYKKADAQGRHKVIFQGPKAGYEVSIWSENPNVSKPSKPLGVKRPFSPMHPGPQLYRWVDQIGSDEVGTGDFFGPVCVCAAFVDRKGLEEIQQLGVTDSKQMDDAYIREIGPKLIHDFEYSQLCLDNPKYNEVQKKGLNMNRIKAKMHNRCLLNLSKKHPGVMLCQDQFAEPGLYYHYLKGEHEIAENIHFSTKGEMAFPSVALGSVIARYSFLMKMDALSAKYGKRIPLGSGEEVDAFARWFLKKYGLKELQKVTKNNFANMKKLLGSDPLL